MNNRIIELEIKTALLEETVDSLSSTMARQQKELDLLQAQLRHMYRLYNNSQEQANSSNGFSLRDEIPPHY